MATSDKYPIPNIQNFTETIFESKFCTTLDLIRAYYHIPISSSDIEKTAIITFFGFLEFPRMGFGLRNAVQTYKGSCIAFYAD